MQTSTRMTAISVLEQLLQRLAPEAALMRFSPRSCRIGLVAQQLGRLIVDQQDVDLVVHPIRFLRR